VVDTARRFEKENDADGTIEAEEEEWAGERGTGDSAGAGG
jgi:hypothetical protein